MESSQFALEFYWKGCIKNLEDELASYDLLHLSSLTHSETIILSSPRYFFIFLCVLIFLHVITNSRMCQTPTDGA